MLVFSAILACLIHYLKLVWGCGCANPKLLLASSYSGSASIKVWDPNKDIACFLSLSLKGNPGGIRKLVFRSDATKLFSVSDSGTIISWDLKTGQSLNTVMNAHTSTVTDLEISGNDNYLMTSSMDEGIKIWMTADLSLVRTITATNNWSVFTIKLSQDGSKIAASVGWGSSYAVEVFDFVSGASLQIKPGANSNDMSREVGWTGTGRYIYAIGDEKKLNRFDTALSYAMDQSPYTSLPDYPREGSTAYAFGRNELLVSGGTTLQFWNTGSWSLSSSITLNVSPYVKNIEISKDEKYILIQSVSGTDLQIYDYSTKTLIKSISEPSSISASAIGSKCYCSSSSGICCDCTFGLDPNPVTAICPSTYFSSDTCGLICTSPCKTCVTTPTSCLTCISNTYLSGTSCINTCPQGTYPDSNDWKCKPCHSSCFTCNGPNSNNCVSCSGSNFLESATCSSTCPSGKFGQASDKTCQPCISPCLNCAGAASSCTSCVNLFLYASNCMNTCPTAYFNQVSDWTCQPCHPSCPTCNGASSNNCLSCSGVNFLESGACNPTCPSGKFGQTSDHTCQPCISPCQNCAGAGTSCTSCVANFYLYASTCINPCPTSYYGRSNDWTCQPCHSSCLTCNGPNSDNCLSCSGINFLESAACTPTCPSGKFGRTSDNTCQNCQFPCQNCGSLTSCTTCVPNTNLFGSSCVTTCPTGYYANNGLCQPCFSTCFTCSGGNFDNCNGCSSPNFLEGTTCIQTCPRGKFGDSGKRACQPCSVNCDTCSGTAYSCDSCVSNYYYHLASKTCNQGCLEGSYGNSSTFKCEASCGKGQYSNELRICLQCSDPCIECVLSGTGNECTSCAVNQFLYQQTCVPTCPEGFYANSNNSCANCPINCKLCNSPSNCMECVPNFYISQEDKSCVACEKPTDIKDGLMCVQCVLNCEFCQTKGVCLKCSAGFFLKSADKCTPIKVLVPAISFGVNYFTAFIDFGSSTQLFIDAIAGNVLDYIKVNISGLSSNDFSFSCGKNSSSRLLFLFNFRVNITQGSRLTIKIEQQDWMKRDIEEILGADNFSLTFPQLIEVCRPGFTRNLVTGLCQGTEIITPELKTTLNPQKINLAFDKPFLELFEKLVAITSVSIDGIDSSQFSYDMYQISDLNFEILIKKLKSAPSPLMIVTLLLPLEIKLNTDYQLSTTQLSLSLWNYIDMDSPEMKEAEKTASTVATAATMTQSTKVLATAASSSSQNLRGAMAAESIHMFRFIDVNLPSNCINIFQNPTEKTSWLDKFKINKDLRDPSPTGKFGEYNTDTYIINNLLTEITKIIILVLIAGIIRIIPVRKEILRVKLFKRFMLYYLFSIFVWGMPINTCMSTYPMFSFYLFVSFRWTSFSSTKGILNFFASVVITIYMILFQIFLIKNIILIKNYMQNTDETKQSKESTNEKNKSKVGKKIKSKRQRSSRKNSMKYNSPVKLPTRRREFQEALGIVEISINNDLEEFNKENDSTRKLKQEKDEAIKAEFLNRKSVRERSKSIIDKNIVKNNSSEESPANGSALREVQSVLEVPIKNDFQQLQNESGRSQNQGNQMPSVKASSRKSLREFLFEPQPDKQESSKYKKQSLANGSVLREVHNVLEVPVKNDSQQRQNDSGQNSRQGDQIPRKSLREFLFEPIPDNKETNKDEKDIEKHPHLLYFDKTDKDQYLQRFEVIHDDFKYTDGFKYNCLYPLLFVNRYLINYFVLVILSRFTYAQIIVTCSTNLSVVLFSVIFRPFKGNKIFFLAFINEVILCVINGCIAYIFFLDRYNDFDLQKRFLIGRIILYSNIFLNYLSASIFYIELILLFVSFTKVLSLYCEEYRNSKRK